MRRVGEVERLLTAYAASMARTAGCRAVAVDVGFVFTSQVRRAWAMGGGA